MIKVSYLMLVISLASCSTSLSSLDEASKKYKADRDYVSLQIIHKRLVIGSSRIEVERLLGTPDYSPTDGLYYYSSNKRILLEDENRYLSPGLTVDYRDQNGVVTDRLQQLQLRNIGE